MAESEDDSDRTSGRARSGRRGGRKPTEREADGRRRRMDPEQGDEGIPISIDDVDDSLAFAELINAVRPLPKQVATAILLHLITADPYKIDRHDLIALTTAATLGRIYGRDIPGEHIVVRRELDDILRAAQEGYAAVLRRTDHRYRQRMTA